MHDAFVLHKAFLLLFDLQSILEVRTARIFFLSIQELVLQMQQCFSVCSQCASLNFVFLKKR